MPKVSPLRGKTMQEITGNPAWVSPRKGKSTRPKGTPLKHSRVPPDRLNEVETLMLAITPRAKIVQQITKKYLVSDMTVYADMKRIKEKLCEQIHTENPLYTAVQCRAMLDEAYRTARTERDARSMVMATKTIAEITGIIAAKRVDVTTGGKPLNALTDEELARRIAELEALVAK